MERYLYFRTVADEDDDDALAAEWEAMAGGDEDGDDGGEDMAAEWESMLGDEDGGGVTGLEYVKNIAPDLFSQFGIQVGEGLVEQ